MSTFKFGTVTVPDGRRGPWRIDTFKLTEEDVMLQNLRHLRDSNAYMVCPPGEYRRLTHRERGVIMSNTPMEILTAREAIRDAAGKVFVSGLGLGMVVEAMLRKPEVLSVVVAELDADVMALVGPTVSRVAAEQGKALTVMRCDVETFAPVAGEHFDYAWHDIWDQIDDDNLPQMTRIMSKFRPFAKRQACWSRPQALALKREMNRITVIG